jgi:orotate phosphoribosyltransferase
MKASLEYDTLRASLSAIVADHRPELKQLLREKSLKLGPITLSSGKVSDYYLDCKLTTLDPRGALLTGYAIYELLEREGIQPDAIGGPEIGAIPIATMVAAVSQIEKQPLAAFLVRKERKAHGLQRRIEGIDLESVKKVVVVDEVCTTGTSIEWALEAVRDEGLDVLAVVSLVDREEGGSDRLREQGYRYFRVFTAQELKGEEQAASGSRQVVKHAR